MYDNIRLVISSYGKITPEMIAKKIKDNKSHGVDRIPLKLLMETVEQISI